MRLQLGTVMVQKAVLSIFTAKLNRHLNFIALSRKVRRIYLNTFVHLGILRAFFEQLSALILMLDWCMSLYELNFGFNHGARLHTNVF